MIHVFLCHVNSQMERRFQVVLEIAGRKSSLLSEKNIDVVSESRRGLEERMTPENVHSLAKIDPHDRMLLGLVCFRLS